MDRTLSTNEQLMEQWNRDWQRLSSLHKREVVLPPDDDPSNYVLVFPLSFIINKCYNYVPLVTLAEARIPYIADKLRYYMQFQVVFLPHGHLHVCHGE